MKVSVIGAGYVGLVTGVCLASRGHDVVCVDTDPAKIAAIEALQPLIHEDGLDALLRATLGTTFRVRADLADAVATTDVTLIAVGTPSTPDGIDLTYVRDAATQIGAVLRGKDSFHAVVVKSTVVPGSTDLTVLPAVEEASGKRAGIDFGVGVNPEFLTEGRAVDDFMAPDRIVIGAGDARTSAMLTELYDSFPGVEVIITTTRTAEMIKYASNAMLATLISFSNELANLGAAIGGIDTVDVMRGLHASRYFTARDAKGDTTAEAASFLFAGCGFGGSCLPKDVTALAAHGRTHGVPMRVLESVLEVNAGQPATLVELTTRALGSLGGRTIAVLGLAFKPDTNDTRESPAFAVIRLLRAGGARVIAHDPVVTQAEVPDDILDGIELCTDLGSALRAADAAVIVTSWREYAALPSLLASIDPQPLVVDGRRMLDPDSVARYVGIGR